MYITLRASFYMIDSSSIYPIMDAWFKEASQSIDKSKVCTPFTALR